ncbi:MAG: hypothetical protein H7Z16_01065 [Pyrinomonadaceae bacterium]|nr:hypothetical protein [Pyrinomonadaceae bacterium]
MRNTMFLLLISSVSMSGFPYQNPVPPQESSSMEVLEFKWFKRSQPAEQLEAGQAQPVGAVQPANKNFQRNMRVNQSRGARDPTADTLDSRSAELERSVQESRGPKPVDGFAYRVKVKNGSPKVADIVFWEYQFIDPSNPGTPARRQFLCAVKVESNKSKEIQGFSLSGPGDVVSAASGAIASGKLLQEQAVINRVEYIDGSIWQRKDWNFAEIKQSYLRAVGAPWGKEMCRVL